MVVLSSLQSNCKQIHMDAMIISFTQMEKSSLLYEMETYVQQLESTLIQFILWHLH